MFLGAITFCIFNGLKIIYLKNNFNIDDFLLTGLVLFSASLLKYSVLAYLYPDADKNKDGLVTNREFYAWKNKIESELNQVKPN